MSNFPDRTDPGLQTEEEAHSPESVLQRLREERSRGGALPILGWRIPWPIIAGVLIVFVLAMAFILRPGESDDPTKAAAPTSAPAATAAPAAAAIPTSAAQPTSIPAAPSERIHTVVSGDTLGMLAEKYYDDPSKWTVIFEANGDILEDPDTLQLGQELKIPD
jgi:nucleoid-associated protein YgaU